MSHSTHLTVLFILLSQFPASRSPKFAYRTPLRSSEINEHSDLAADSSHDLQQRFQQVRQESGVSKDALSLQDTTNPKNGIVFINGYADGGKVIFIYRFDNDPYIYTEPVQPTDWTLGTEVPFAKRNFSVIAVKEATFEIISARIFSFTEIMAVVLNDIPDNKIDLWNLPDPFSSTLIFLNFNNPATSPYRYLWVDGNFLGDAGVSEYNGYILISSQDMSITTSFTNIFYQLCDSPFLNINCQNFLSPYLGALEPAEVVWVMFSPLRQLQFTSYNPSPIVKPNFINSYYNISSNVGFQGASQLVFESLNLTFSPEDLRQFQDENGLPHTNLTGDYFGGIDTQNLCSTNPNNCDEPNLDVQLITSISQYPTTTSLFYESDSSTYGFGVAWILYLANLTAPPLVISVSYGDEESFYQPTLVELFNLEAIKVYPN